LNFNVPNSSHAYNAKTPISERLAEFTDVEEKRNLKLESKDRLSISERLADFQKVPLSASLVLDYIAYTREHCSPQMTAEAATVLRDYFMSLWYVINCCTYTNGILTLSNSHVATQQSFKKIVHLSLSFCIDKVPPGWKTETLHNASIRTSIRSIDLIEPSSG
jgi:hypothetical protein